MVGVISVSLTEENKGFMFCCLELGRIKDAKMQNEIAH